jgi:hypothetical protein
MKAKNPNSTQWLNYWQRGDSMASKNLFMYLVCFVVLQVMMKGAW